MSRTVLKDRIALVAGADCPVGWSVALQLSRAGARVVLAGDDGAAIRRLCELIIRKQGEPSECVLPADAAGFPPAVREARDASGHFHFVVNAMALAGGMDRAQALQNAAGEISAERGFVRMVMLLPENAPLPATHATPWESMIQLGKISTGETEDAPGLRPAAIADAIVSLIQCPPSACPAVVKLESVIRKAFPGD